MTFVFGIKNFERSKDSKEKQFLKYSSHSLNLFVYSPSFKTIKAVQL